jgi:S1-C subfamily serine protease
MSGTKFSAYRTWGTIIFVLLSVGVGCSVLNLGAIQDTLSAQVTATPTAAPSPQATAPAPLAAIPNVSEAANALEAQVIAVYDAFGPSVVNITNRGYTYDLFMRAVPQEGSGSGFVYDQEGHIVTNYHVIENAEELLVTLANNQVYEAKVIGSDPANDLAVIGIDAKEGLPEPMVLGDSDKLKVGQFVVAIGNPFGLERTLTTGVISALGRVIQSPDPQANRFIGEAIQTDAAINPGNSGGPLLDLRGQVIGVNSQIISPSRASAGIGFAVSANTVRRVVPELISRGYYPHPWLGAQLLPLTPAVAKVFREAGMDVPVDAGLMITETVPRGPAAKAELHGAQQAARVGRYQVPLGGDIIVAINGEPITDFEELTVYLETHTAVGDTVDVTIIRNGKEQTVPLTLDERPQS